MPFGIYSERIDRYSSVTNPSTSAITAQQNSVNPFLASILKTHFQEKSVVPAGSSPVILVMLEMR